MNEPLVTILVPCYNVGQYIGQCIESILSQSYRNLQIVLIDDGSTDNTWQVIVRYASLDSRLEVHRQLNQGVALTRNNLLRYIKGDFTLFVDSDDWIDCEMVEFLVDKILVNNADIAMCGIVVDNGSFHDNYSERILTCEETIKLFLFHTELKGSLCNKLIRTNLLQEVTFNPDVSYGEDALFCWNVFQNLGKAVMTDRPLYHYRMNTESISHQTFGPKKLTGNYVWNLISEQTREKWPKFLDIAHARHGMENMYLLMQASQAGYAADESIRRLQKNVKSFFSDMIHVGMLRGKEILNAFIIGRWYGYGRVYERLHTFKTKFK